MTELVGAVVLAGGGASRPLPVSAIGAARQPTPAPSRAQLDRSIQQLKQFMQSQDRSVRFEIDQQTHMTIVRIYDESTGELVRQIPAEEVVHVAKWLSSQQSSGKLAVEA